MKRILAFLLLFCLLISFASCGKGNTIDPSEESVATESSDAESFISEEVSSKDASENFISEESIAEEESESFESTEAQSSENADDSTELSTNDSTDIGTNDSTEGDNCTHRETEKRGEIEATCDEEGYSGDIVCLKCGELILKGESTKKSDKHGETYVKGFVAATNTADGYTGDITCKLCDTILEAGKPIPKEEPKPCAHSNTTLINTKAATCAEEGYTGDTLCNDCNTTVKTGEPTNKLDAHGETKLIGKTEATFEAEGYTGDEVCSICGFVITKGETIPKRVQTVTYTDSFGNKISLPKDVDPFVYTLENATLPKVEHLTDILTVEKEIFNLMNEERTKAGVAPIEWCEDAYYFAYTRAQEQEQLWSHTRPNGYGFSQIFSEHNVFPLKCGENLFAITTTPDTVAEVAIESWMNSDGHRKNILNADWKYVAIGVYYSELNGRTYAVQLFFA